LSATLVLVRSDPQKPGRSHPADFEKAKRAGQKQSTWIVLLGAAGKAKPDTREKHRVARRTRMRKALGFKPDQISGRGVSVFFPVELVGEDHNGDLADVLARYLVDKGIPMVLRQSAALTVPLAEDLDRVLFAAAVEAAAVYPRVNLEVGDMPLRSSLRWELRRDLFQAPPPRHTASDLIGDAPMLKKVREKIARYAREPYPVLIIGATGTGKEIVARMLHEESGRRGRFMAQNAAQLPPELADSLLFGHKRGAFTGADSDRPGRIREAEAGTFFLDETFNLAPSVQGKLLRALNKVNEGIIVVEPVGDTNLHHVHTRLVVSALKDPRGTGDDATAAMRLDLFYRVSVGIIRLPQLRETLEDLPILCKGLLGRLGGGVEVTDDGISELATYHWPGNVRELELILLRALMDAPAGTTRLDGEALKAAVRTNGLPPGTPSLRLPCDLDLKLARIEVATLRAALRQAGGVHSRAGLRIGMDPQTAKNFGRRLRTAEERFERLQKAAAARAEAEVEGHTFDEDGPMEEPV
jgi:transcriptional regulator with GAF, ATPase, and Fis domain